MTDRSPPRDPTAIVARLDPPRIVLALAAVLGGLLLAGLLLSGATFGALNPTWEGASELQTHAETVGTDSQVVTNTRRYRTVPPTGTVAVVVAPSEGYTPAERARLERFVRAGGTLLVADDFGSHSNDLLRGVGASARIHGSLLRDEVSYYRSPMLPVADNVTPAGPTRGVDDVTMNHGSIVVPGNATVLVRSSAFGYLDYNRNHTLDNTETLAAYPVVTTERVGDGTVIVVGDASVFVNEMLRRDGNRRFTRNVFATHERVLLDYSHREPLPPVRASIVVLTGRPLLQGAAGVLIVALVAVWVELDRRRLPVVDPGEPDTPPSVDVDTYVAVLRARHPEWDPDRLETTAEAWLREEDDGD